MSDAHSTDVTKFAHTSTGSEAFSLFICLDANKFVLLSVFSLIKTIYPRVTRLTSVAQKRCLLSFLTSSENCAIHQIIRKPNALIVLIFIQNNSTFMGARVAQLDSAQPSVRKVPCSIPGVTSHPCFNLSPFCVALTSFKYPWNGAYDEERAPGEGGGGDERFVYLKIISYYCHELSIMFALPFTFYIVNVFQVLCTLGGCEELSIGRSPFLP